jgi:hypothetical protein
MFRLRSPQLVNACHELQAALKLQSDSAPAWGLLGVRRQRDPGAVGLPAENGKFSTQNWTIMPFHVISRILKHVEDFENMLWLYDILTKEKMGVNYHTKHVI